MQIGSTHSLCQDYVIARNGSANDSFVILSDGCSSSPDTDIGARLLVKAAEKIFTEQGIDNVEQLHKEAARLALDWAAGIGVPAQAVDATLMTVHVSGESLIVACSGDGVIVLEAREGYLDFYVISCLSGYPHYPSYTHQPDRLGELLSNDRTTKEIKHLHRESLSSPFKVVNVVTSDSLTEVFKLKASEYKYAAVASDGINSFFQTCLSTNGKRVEEVCLFDVLHEFWSFKNSHGAFVERRLNRFTKDVGAKGWQHADDMSIGVIHLGENNVRHS